MPELTAPGEVSAAGRGSPPPLRISIGRLVALATFGDDVEHCLDGCDAVRDGQPIDPQNVLRSVKEAAKRAELTKEVQVHTLRHSAATAMLSGGESLFSVSRHLGHESIDVTVRYYGHLTDNGLRQASETLARVLGV